MCERSSKSHTNVANTCFYDLSINKAQKNRLQFTPATTRYRSPDFDSSVCSNILSLSLSPPLGLLFLSLLLSLSLSLLLVSLSLAVVVEVAIAFSNSKHDNKATFLEELVRGMLAKHWRNGGQLLKY